jgi:hypothetical protein
LESRIKAVRPFAYESNISRLAAAFQRAFSHCFSDNLFCRIAAAKTFVNRLDIFL